MAIEKVFAINAGAEKIFERFTRGSGQRRSEGAGLGLACGMGSAGREYVPGRIHRADRMAATAAQVSRINAGEPYRQALTLMRERLHASLS